MFLSRLCSLTGRFSFCCRAAFFFQSRCRSSASRRSIAATSRFLLFRLSLCCCSLPLWSWFSLFLNWKSGRKRSEKQVRREEANTAKSILALLPCLVQASQCAENPPSWWLLSGLQDLILGEFWWRGWSLVLRQNFYHQRVWSWTLWGSLTSDQLVIWCPRFKLCIDRTNQRPLRNYQQLQVCFRCDSQREKQTHMWAPPEVSVATLASLYQNRRVCFIKE